MARIKPSPAEISLSSEQTKRLCDTALRALSPRRRLAAALGAGDDALFLYAAGTRGISKRTALKVVFEAGRLDLLTRFLKDFDVPKAEVSAYVVELLCNDTKHEMMAGLEVFAAHIHWGSVLSHCSQYKAFERVWAAMQEGQQTNFNAELGLSHCLRDLTPKQLREHIPSTHIPNRLIPLLLGTGTANTTLLKFLAAEHPGAFSIDNLLAKKEWRPRNLFELFDPDSWGAQLWRHIMLHAEISENDYACLIGRMTGHLRYHRLQVPVPPRLRLATIWQDISACCRIVKDEADMEGSPF
jgi:hypothetical protein